MSELNKANARMAKNPAIINMVKRKNEEGLETGEIAKDLHIAEAVVIYILRND